MLHETYVYGTDLIRTERWSDASSVFEHIVSENTSDFASWYNLAYAYWRLGRHDNCLAAAVQASKLQPDLAQAHELIGEVYLVRLELELSGEAFSRAVDLDPNIAVAWIGLGKVCRRRKEYHKALRCFNTAEDIEGLSEETQRETGMCYEDLGDHDKARVAFERALVLMPDDQDIALRLARALVHSSGPNPSMKKRAERILRVIVSQEPQHAEALCYLALSLNWRIEVVEAVSLLNQAVEFAFDGPSQSRNLYFLGMAYESAGKYDMAIDALLRARDLRSDMPERQEAIRRLKSRIEQL